MPTSKKSRKTQKFDIRMSEQEQFLVREAARRYQTTPTSFIRDRAVSAAEEALSQKAFGLIDKLSPAQAYALRKKLDNKLWGDQLEALFSEVDERNTGLPPISEEEIVAAVKELREELKTESAQSSN
jgi:uncharacterized protein (DUF1778 family)